MKTLATMLDILGGLAVFAFLIWATYFASSGYSLTFWRGVGAFALLFLFSGTMHMIPYIGASFLPVAWEWWWHDISIAEVSMLAWIVAGFSLFTKIFLNVVVVREVLQTERDSE